MLTRPAPLPSHVPGSTAAPDSPGPWRLLMTGVVLYVFLRFLNEIAGGNQDLLGALVFLALLAQISLPRFFPLPLTRWSAAILLAAIFPILAFLSGKAPLYEESTPYVFKHFALLFVFLSAALLRLPPIFRSPERAWGFASMLFILLAGIALGLSEGRVAGSFANPNNYALAAMSLLFFSDPLRDKPWQILCVYALVFVLILISGTTGAMAGYLAGVAAALLRTRYARTIAVLMAAGLLFGLGLLLFLRGADPQALGETPGIGPIWTKLYIAQQHFDEVRSGQDLDFWGLGLEHGGTDLTSGVWRLVHWRETLLIIGEADLSRQIFGHGLGTSMRNLGNLPHNDYLRLLYELGLAGTVAYLMVWMIPALHMEPSARGPAVMLAVYAFSENNLDNFLVMSLFALFLVSARQTTPPPSLRPRGQA